MSNSKALVLLSGSIAAFKAVELISLLRKSGVEVRVACTKNTFEFIGASSLEGISGQQILSDTFASGEAMSHIDWTRWADWAVLCPATANTINRLACGLAEDIVGNLALAWPRQKPFFVVPAMNTQMYQHPATQRSLKQLTEDGYDVLPTQFGDLACGETGWGRMLEAQSVHQHIQQTLQRRHKKTKKVLITSGGTREPIDGVRYITNFSTGRTGAFLADRLASAGFAVTQLAARDSARAPAPVTARDFTTFADLNEKLATELKNEHFDAVLHLAAVSDYSVSEITQDGVIVKNPTEMKISSNAEVHLQLKRNFKILNHLKKYSRNKEIKVVAFKLTQTTDVDAQVAAVNALLEGNDVDIVVHNDKLEIDAGRHHFAIYDKFLRPTACADHAHLADELVRLLNDRLEIRPSPNQEVQL